MRPRKPRTIIWFGPISIFEFLIPLAYEATIFCGFAGVAVVLNKIIQFRVGINWKKHRAFQITFTHGS